MQPVLEVQDVTKVFGSKSNEFTALHNINVKVEEGEFVGIMGPSGAGKTTLLNVVSTIDDPSSGRIIIGGKDITKMKEKELSLFRREKLGFIFQDYNLLDSLTVRENIALPLALAKKKAKEVDRRVEEIAAKFGMTEILEKHPYQISGGQKQRCAACRAIVTNPNLIFGDEPTGALDSKSATDLLNSLKSLNEEERATILMVTHDAFAASYCERVLVIKDGVLFKELLKKGRTRKAFFNDILELMGEIGGHDDELI